MIHFSLMPYYINMLSSANIYEITFDLPRFWIFSSVNAVISSNTTSRWESYNSFALLYQKDKKVQTTVFYWSSTYWMKHGGLTSFLSYGVGGGNWHLSTFCCSPFFCSFISFYFEKYNCLLFRMILLAQHNVFGILS